MYIFSANGTARVDRDDIRKGDRKPFIVYIDYVDRFGAEQLCKVYLMRAGFTDIEIENHKFVGESLRKDPRVVEADKAMQAAIKGGYMIQMFDE
ncbi:hypothetical protein [Marinimicrobium sp. ARAG 43.8]|uniref:hypothetical protein n=1 Tax=Marinimicrobium sp. ARAG 43.8 TaxID=3418719 RepID=UPI003CF8E873